MFARRNGARFQNANSSNGNTYSCASLMEPYRPEAARNFALAYRDVAVLQPHPELSVQNRHLKSCPCFALAALFGPANVQGKAFVMLPHT